MQQDAVAAEPTPDTDRARPGNVLSAVTGGIAGVAPHVLHHIAPILGTALLTGVAGTLLFGVVGLLFMIPMLLRLRTRFQTWAAPAFALVLFVAMFGVSTLVVGPLARTALSAAEGFTALHQQHHPAQ